MSKNHEVKSRKNKVALPPTNPGPLNLVTFSFRVHENPAIHSRGIEWAPLGSENKEMNNK